ncbi:proprotein convertase subtilisin/kexin type 5-like, partial [Ruditapes philippinarum]|uniref:proprotein convertase subtilisin/kexin type 5-like n=1 Tax=Ruditapes philippinarum TaxID=129788 RepID=UPI00295AC1DE
MLLKETSALIVVLIVDMVFTECSVGCQSCSGATCTSCESSYSLSNGFCSQCPENCESCNSWDDCTLCKPNKYGLHARCTFICDGNCLNSECADDTGYCTQCKPGFYGHQCQHNCSLCENESCDLRTCSSGCTAGQYDYKTGIETICQNCPTNCKHCTDAKKCYKCNEGYHLYKFNDNVHCMPCLQRTQCSDCVIQGCNKCQIHNDSLVCADCPEGHIFNGKTCTDGCKDGLTGDNCTQTTTIEEATTQTGASSRQTVTAETHTVMQEQTQETVTAGTHTIMQEQTHQTVTEETFTVMQEQKESNNLIIGASAGGAVLILILFIVGVCLLKQRYNNKYENELITIKSLF